MTDWPSQTSPFTQLAAPNRNDRNPTTNVVDLDAGRAAARTGGPRRAAAPSYQQAAMFNAALDRARNAYAAGSADEVLIHLGAALRVIRHEGITP